MAVKIKLMRLGKVREPHYRIVIAPAQSRRDGKVIETIGKYHPKEHPSFIQVDSDRAQYWLGVGAQPTEPVQSILEVTGDWQKFKGLPGSEGSLQQPEPKPDRSEVFARALAEAGDEPSTEATTPRRKRGRQESAAATEGAEASGGAAPSGTPAESESPAETESPAESESAEEPEAADGQA